MATTYAYKAGTVIPLKTDNYYTLSNRFYYAELRITITEIIDDYNFKANIDLWAPTTGQSGTTTAITYGYCQLYLNEQVIFGSYKTTRPRLHVPGYTFVRNVATDVIINIPNGLYPNSNEFKFDASVYYAQAYNCTTTQEIIFKEPEPIYFNGTQINKVYFNNTEVTGDVYFNNTKIT